MIPYGKHCIDQNDIDAVVNVLENEFLTQGTQVPKFEEELSEYCQASYACAVNSGTSALHIACLAMGVGKGDYVWTSPNSFVASANCALYCGAKVDFVDIDTVSHNLCPIQLARKLRSAQSNNCLPKVIIVVHFAGMSCEMTKIKKLADEFGIALIEDASHALGGTYKNYPIGSCRHSDMTVMSFHPVKSITSAEGGAVLTNSRKLYDKLKLFGKHGITRESKFMDGIVDGPWCYQQIDLGYNYRMSDLHAVLGRSQLKKLDGFISKRRELAQRYIDQLGDLPIKLPINSQESAWHLFAIEINRGNRAEIYKHLQDNGVAANVHYIPIHLQPYYRRQGFNKGDFPVAENYYQHAISLPLFPSLTNADQDKVIHILETTMR